MAEGCARLYLYDAAPNVRRKLERRFAAEPRIEIVQDGALEKLEDASLDLVAANSLIQYVPVGETSRLLALWRSKLKPEGRLLLSDIPTATAGAALGDVMALLEFSWRGGFVAAALASLARLYFSDYRRLRKELGFSAYEPGSLEELLRRGGFEPARLRRNIGHNQRRFSLLASKLHSSAIAETNRP
jgi:hypothetical protein